MMRALNKRGSVVIAALLLVSIAAVMAAAFLSQRVSQKSSVTAELRKAKAESLAWAGLEDARVKLMKSPEFPLINEDPKARFTYSERLLDEAGDEVGTYLVRVDSRGNIVCSAFLTGEEKPTVTLRGIIDGKEERRRENINGTEVTENRPFHWLVLEEVDYEASSY